IGREGCCASTSTATRMCRGDEPSQRTSPRETASIARTYNPAMRAFLAATGLLLPACAMQTTSTTPDVTPALRAEFAPSGTLVAGVNYGNIVIAQKPTAGDEPQGIGPSLARELARRLGVPIRYVVYDTAGKMAAVAKEGAWDV